MDKMTLFLGGLHEEACVVSQEWTGSRRRWVSSLVSHAQLLIVGFREL